MKKMFSNINEPICKDLMDLMSSQSHHTLSSWAINYAKENYMPLIQRETEIHELYEECLKLDKLKDQKVVLKKARDSIKQIEESVDLIAYRACVTALSTLSTPTGALGFLFYGSMAKAYREIGMKGDHESLCILELKRAYESLKQVSVKDEKNKVKINWNC